MKGNWAKSLKFYASQSHVVLKMHENAIRLARSGLASRELKVSERRQYERALAERVVRRGVEGDRRVTRRQVLNVTSLSSIKMSMNMR